MLDNDDHSILSNLYKNKKQIEKFKGVNNTIDRFINRIDQIEIEINDFIEEIHHYKSTIHYDSKKIEDLSEKFELIEMLKRKYGGSIASVIEYKKNIIKYMENSSLYKDQIKESIHKLNKLRSYH